MSFDRKASVGECFKLTCTYNLSQSATFKPKESHDPWKRFLTANFTGAWKTLVVNDKGAPSKVTFSIERFNYKQNDGPELSLPSGRIITAELKNTVTVFSMNAGNIPEDLNPILNAFMRLRSEPNSSGDDQYGTKVPRAVGEEWPVSGPTIAAAFHSMGSDVAEKDIKGAVKLTDFRKVDGIDCFVINSDYHATNITMKSTMADRFGTVGDCSERATVILPREIPKKRIGFSHIVEWKYHYDWKPEDGSVTRVDQMSHEEFDEHSSPLEVIEK